MKINLVLVFLLFCLGILPKSWGADDWQKGKVVLDGAMVYEKADFDSPVLTYLPAGKVFYISVKVYGPFYRIQVDKSTSGYISDVDIRPASGASGATIEKDKSKKKTTFDEDENPVRRKEYVDAKYMGLVAYASDYTEYTLKAKRTEKLLFYGAKFTGNDVFLPGGVMDVNLIFHYGPPSFYKKATGFDATGFIVLADMQFINQIRIAKNALIHWGVGPNIHFSKYSVYMKTADNPDANAQLLDLTDIRLMPILSVGLGIRILRASLKIDYRYVYDKTPYSLYGGALLFEL